jgi:hypothetical protein
MATATTSRVLSPAKRALSTNASFSDRSTDWAQACVGSAGVLLELGLLHQQLRIQLLAAALDLVHQGLQLVGHSRQYTGLLLQGLQMRLALMGERKGEEVGRGFGV